MSFKLRQATYTDAASIAYLILVWDKELPDFLKLVQGDAASAYRSAELMCGQSFRTWLMEEDDKVVGLVSIHVQTSLFGFRIYGSIVGVFVLPSYRGGKLLGLKLVRKAMELAAIERWEWLEMNPWADDRNTGQVLQRLGFDEAIHVYALRVR